MLHTLSVLNAPFVWLDVLVCFCIIVAVVSGLLTIGRDPSLLRGRLKYIAGACFGLAFVLGGADRLLTLHFAPRLDFTGTIQSLTNHGGKNPSCTIQMLNPEGERVTFKGEFSCDGLHAGDEAHIAALVFNYSIARLDVIAGPDTGSLRNGGDVFTAAMSLGLGCFLLYSANKSQRTDPTGKPQKQGRDTPLDGDVDTKSLLNLNKPD
jgi:hypothetical protein